MLSRICRLPLTSTPSLNVECPVDNIAGHAETCLLAWYPKVHRVNLRPGVRLRAQNRARHTLASRTCTAPHPTKNIPHHAWHTGHYTEP